jgi:hypothetical protein
VVAQRTEIVGERLPQIIDSVEEDEEALMRQALELSMQDNYSQAVESATTMENQESPGFEDDDDVSVFIKS